MRAAGNTIAPTMTEAEFGKEIVQSLRALIFNMFSVFSGHQCVSGKNPIGEDPNSTYPLTSVGAVQKSALSHHPPARQVNRIGQQGPIQSPVIRLDQAGRHSLAAA